MRNNAVAYIQVIPKKNAKKPRGRPKFYGKKIKLCSLFDKTEHMITAASPVYGEVNVNIQYRCVDLLWKPLKCLVRFVLVIHPSRGQCIFICTDLTLPPIDIIRLYGIRFKIELAFKQALRVVGAYGYHFWMRAMTPIKRFSGNQYVHHETEKYRNDVRSKIVAYDRYVQVGLIAQGLLQYLSVQFPALVWKQFGSWLRTIRVGIPPDLRGFMQPVTGHARRVCFYEIRTGTTRSHAC